MPSRAEKFLKRSMEETLKFQELFTQKHTKVLQQTKHLFQSLSEPIIMAACKDWY
ncbi:MAG: hypothetical protein ACI910_003260 [Oleispira sp.]|jgi:hypothetical protein